MQNKNKILKTGANLRFSCFCRIYIVFFRLVQVEYDLFKPSTFIQNCIYMNFRINLTQFISISRDRNAR